MKAEDIVKCHFVPMSTMQRVLDLIETPPSMPHRRCKRNLQELQLRRSSSQSTTGKAWKTQYQIALSQAVYAHDWNKLLYLLRKSPIWEQSLRVQEELSCYVRALTILLMNHPTSKAQGLLNEFLHMVLSCRSDEDKKAVLKVILTLPDKILRTAKSTELGSF